LRAFVRALCWLGGGAVVVLAARAIAYALAPGPLARALERDAGGPRLPMICIAALGLALGVSSAILWLAALGVRERRLLDAAPVAEVPRLRLRRGALRTLLLFVGTTLGFALLESYLHWRAGLGWHALHCLSGPVHQSVFPILAALSLVAAALAAAVEHVLGWMRRTLVRLRPGRPRLASLLPPAAAVPPIFPSPRRASRACGARAPPLPAS
jgi:hypothetical protein